MKTKVNSLDTVNKDKLIKIIMVELDVDKITKKLLGEFWKSKRIRIQIAFKCL